MRIALVSDCYHPTKNGVSRMVALQRDGLTGRGHEVTLIAPAGPTRRTRRGGGQRETGEVSPPPEHPVVGADLAVTSWPLFPSVQVRLAASSVRHLRGWLRRHRVEVVHTHTEGPLGRAARSAASREGIPTVHTLHTLYDHYLHYLWPAHRAPRTSGRLLRRALGGFLGRVDHVIAPSTAARHRSGAVAPGVPVTVIPNAVGPPARTSRTDPPLHGFGLDPSRRIVLYVGRMAREKRSDELVRALVRQLPVHPEVVAVLAGGGRRLRPLRRLVVRSGLADRLLLPGYLEHDEVQELYRRASVFVTASVSENHPLTLIEAASHGLPLVVRDDDNLRGLVVDERNGLVTGSDERLVAGALALATDPRRARALGTRSRAVAAELHVDAHLDAVEGVYAAALAARVAAAPGR